MNDPTPGLCCTHGAKLDRAVELLEDLHAARVGKQGRVSTPPKWSRWRTAAAIVGMVLGFVALAIGSWWLWGVFIQMHV